MKTGLSNALTDLADDIFCERTVTGKDYGFGPYTSASDDRPTAGAMAAVLSDYISRKTKGRLVVTAASPVSVAEPRSDRTYFKLAPAQESLDESLMPARYFSIPSCGDGEVLYHDGVSPEEMSARLADKEAFDNEVQCITAGEHYAAKLHQNLLCYARAMIAAAVVKEHGSGLESRLKAAARIIGAEDLYTIHKNLDGHDLATLCAVLTALGASDQLDSL